MALNNNPLFDTRSRTTNIFYPYVSADNRQKKQRRLEKQDFSMFTQPDDHRQWISSHLALAAYRFLSTCKIRIILFWKMFIFVDMIYLLDTEHGCLLLKSTFAVKPVYKGH